MLDYIVLGQIPGTSLQLGFVGYLAFADLALTFYILRKYHPKKLHMLATKLKIDKKLKKLQKGLKKFDKKPVKKLRSYKKRTVKRLVHFRHDVLGPKLKFLK